MNFLEEQYFQKATVYICDLTGKHKGVQLDSNSIGKIYRTFSYILVFLFLLIMLYFSMRTGSMGPRSGAGKQQQMI